MILDIINWLIELIDRIGYLGVFISMFIESFFAPIPSELILPFAGFISAEGGMNLLLVIVVGSLASALGSLPFYFIGYWGNDVVLNKFIGRYGKYLFISEKDVEKGVAFFDKYGKAVVLFGRLIPIIRTVISFPAGLVKMNFLQFFSFSLVGSLVWSAFLASLGFYMGAQWSTVSVIIEEYQHIVIIVGVIAVLFFFASKIREKILSKRGE